PLAGAAVPSGTPLDFSWTQASDALLYRLEIADGEGKEVFSALLQQGIGSYRAPSFLREKGTNGKLRWRVVVIGPENRPVAASEWREVRLAAK
ncbi:MAG: hypothetical protein M3R62_09125, partial [Acidobacteriota bacterium]|nr:hypothetical protein [Acidobacteriota bacterium]